MEGYKLLKRTLDLAFEIRKLINTTRAFRVLELEDLLPEAVRHDGIRLDPTKVTVDISGCGYTVDELQKELFDRYNIQIEKSTFNTITLLLTIGTTRSKVSRLYDALMRLAREKRAPRRLVRTPEIPAFTKLRYLPRDAYYCGGELVPVFDDKERVNRALSAARLCRRHRALPARHPGAGARPADHAEGRRVPRQPAALAEAHRGPRHRARGLPALRPGAEAGGRTGPQTNRLSPRPAFAACAAWVERRPLPDFMTR